MSNPCTLTNKYTHKTKKGQHVSEDETNTYRAEASTVGEFIEMSRLVSIDDCGVMYEEELDYDQAEIEFIYLKSLNKTIPIPLDFGDVADDDDDDNDDDDDDDRRRRMQGSLGGSDVQIPIGQTSSLSGSDQSIGCITYESGSGGWGGFEGTSYYYDHICTGTLIAPYWVLTSGSCCYPPGGQNYYKNWVYYPEIRYYDDIYTYQYRETSYRSSRYNLKSYRVQQAFIYDAWKGGNYDWDICIFKLWYPYWNGYFIRLDYSIETYLTSTQITSTVYNSWNSLGYRYDRYSNDYNDGYLLYGWKYKQITEISTHYFSYTMDAYSGNTHYGNGYNGAPLFYERNSKQYCVTSNSYNRYKKSRNYCTRITQTSYNDFCGQYSGRGYGYCNSY